MGRFMRNILLILLAAILVFGCLGGGDKANVTVPSKNVTIPGLPVIEENKTVSDGCVKASYSFSTIDDGTFSKTSKLVATVTCGGGKKLAVTLDGTEVDSETVSTNGTTTLTFDVVAIKEGTLKLKVVRGTETLLSRDWKVEPLGNSSIAGVGNDAVSYKEYRAMALDVENAVDVGQVKLYMKRLQSKTAPGNYIVVEIRKDSGNEPGSLVSSIKRPMTAVTMSDNWLKFDLASKTKLAPGRYWIVMKVEMTEEAETLVSDVANIHYTEVDRTENGNNYTKQMMLTVDSTTGKTTETRWEPLSYDRVYSIVMTSG
jgi:hypothetical protein